MYRFLLVIFDLAVFLMGRSFKLGILIGLTMYFASVSAEKAQTGLMDLGPFTRVMVSK